MLGVYLEWPKIESAQELVAACLAKGDLDANDVVISTIGESLSSLLEAGSDPNGVLEALSTIKPAKARPKWSEQLKLWQEEFGGLAKSEKKSENGTK